MNLQIANLYAKEFLIYIRDQKLDINKIIQIISSFIIFLEDKKITQYLYSPVIKSEKKMDLIETQIQDKDLLKLISVINKRKQMTNLLNIFKAIIKNNKLQNNIIEIIVESIIYLNNQQKENVSLLIKNYFGYEGEITNIINKAIIGGLVIKFNDYVLDLSIRKQLDLMKKKVFAIAVK